MFKFNFDTSNSEYNKQDDQQDDVKLIASEEVLPDDKASTYRPELLFLFLSNLTRISLHPSVNRTCMGCYSFDG